MNRSPYPENRGNFSGENEGIIELPVYSFIIPIYNEEETLPLLYQRMNGLLAKLDGPSEVILVDDGSRDNSPSIMSEMHFSDYRFKVVELSRNFGHQMAITAGMDVCSGQAIIVMDADLQDPPETVLDLIAKWKEGYEIVYAIREAREGEGWFKKETAALYYRLLNKLTEIKIPADVGDFRLIDRKALAAFKQMRERNRYVRGMFTWVGFKQTGVTYVRSQRAAGETKYPLRKMLALAFDGILGFSKYPLHLAVKLGFMVSATSFLAGISLIILKLTGAYVVSGWTSLAVLISFLGGMQLAVLGIVGEYVGRVYDEVRDRPLYFIRETQGISAAHVSPMDVELGASEHVAGYHEDRL